MKAFLDALVVRHNQPQFMTDDPIGIPHRYTLPQDIEITAFWVSMLAWGQRKTIIAKANELFALMDNAPYDFICNHTERDRMRFEAFKHRTFQPLDTLYFLEFLQTHFRANNSLETAFTRTLRDSDPTIENALIGFHDYFFSLPDAPQRTRKHVSTPANGSCCKRLCMFLRWMVRNDDAGVDFGLWQTVRPAQLVMPLDVHTDRQARRLGLLTRPKTDWQAALELTAALRTFDAADPVRYDFALFGLGIDLQNGAGLK